MSIMHQAGNTTEQYSPTTQYGVPASVQSPLQVPSPAVQNPLLFFQGTLTHNGWNQQAPAQMPWSTQRPTDQRIVKFQGDTLSQLPNVVPQNESMAWWQTPQVDFTDGTSFADAHGSHKRKLDTFVEGPTRKQLITDEKMAAELDRLHITVPPASRTNTPEIPTENCSRRLPLLVLSEELKRLQKEPLIPTSLLESFSGPSKAVVLWKPPAGSIRELLASVSSRPKDEDEKDNAESEKSNVIPEPADLMEDEPIAPDFENNNNVPYTDQEDAELDL